MPVIFRRNNITARRNSIETLRHFPERRPVVTLHYGFLRFRPHRSARRRRISYRDRRHRIIRRGKRRIGRDRGLFRCDFKDIFSRAAAAKECAERFR